MRGAATLMSAPVDNNVASHRARLIAHPAVHVRVRALQLDQRGAHHGAQDIASVGELRGLKGSLYEGGVRVPTIVRYPGHVAAGSTSDRVSGFEDWMPTLLELIGAKDVIPANIDGI